MADMSHRRDQVSILIINERVYLLSSGVSHLPVTLPRKLDYTQFLLTVAEINSRTFTERRGETYSTPMQLWY